MNTKGRVATVTRDPLPEPVNGKDSHQSSRPVEILHSCPLCNGLHISLQYFTLNTTDEEEFVAKAKRVVRREDLIAPMLAGNIARIHQEAGNLELHLQRAAGNPGWRPSAVIVGMNIGPPPAA